MIPTDRFPPGTSATLAKGLRSDQVVRDSPEASVDRDFVPPRERDLPTGDDPTVAYLIIFAGLAILGLALAWLVGYWSF